MPQSTADPKVERVAMSPREAAEALGVSVPTVYELLRSGRLASVKVGTRRLIPVTGLRRLVDGDQS